MNGTSLLVGRLGKIFYKYDDNRLILLIVTRRPVFKPAARFEGCGPPPPPLIGFGEPESRPNLDRLCRLAFAFVAVNRHVLLCSARLRFGRGRARLIEDLFSLLSLFPPVFHFNRLVLIGNHQ